MTIILFDQFLINIIFDKFQGRILFCLIFDQIIMKSDRVLINIEYTD